MIGKTGSIIYQIVQNIVLNIFIPFVAPSALQSFHNNKEPDPYPYYSKYHVFTNSGIFIIHTYIAQAIF